MRRIAWVRLSLAACIALASPAHAEIYRYVDADGREHWTEDPSKVPAAQRQSAPSSGGSLSGFEPARPSAPAREPVRSPVQSSIPAVVAPAPPPSADQIDGLYEADWRASAERHRRRVDEAERALAKCEQQDERRRLVYGLTELDACESKQSRIESAEAELEHFEDLARRRGVPPGWLR